MLELLPRYPARRLRAAAGFMSPAQNGTLVPLTAVTKMTASTMPLSSTMPARFPP